MQILNDYDEFKWAFALEISSIQMAVGVKTLMPPIAPAPVSARPHIELINQ